MTDVNPDSLTSGDLFGGRTVAFSVNPINTQIVFAATEFGGLFRSVSHGASWAHVNQVPLTAMQDVQFASSDANLVIATGAYDGSTDNRGGGIWRSTDGGATWAQAPGSNVCPTTSQNNGRKVSIAPGSPGALTIFVGTDCGLARSTTSGSSWTRIQPAGGRFWDVTTRQVATPSPHLQIDTCGDNGYFRSNDGGATWPTSTAFPSGGFIPCRVATAPQDPNTVFMATRSPTANPGDGIGETFQFESDNGGSSFTNLNVSIDGNGRDPSVLVFPGFDGAANHFEVFFMTDQVTMHQQCDTNNAQRCGSGAPGANTATCGPPPGSTNGPWKQYDSSIPHCAQDPGALALDPTTGCPFLEGGDGGIFQTANGCVDSPTFTNANAGLHAQWVYQVAATAVPGGSGCCPTPHTSVYSGMQDNGQVCSNNDATSFKGCGGADVFNTLADANGPPSSLLKNQNGGFSLSNEDASPTGWTSPTGRIDGVAQFGFHSYAFITDDNPAAPTAPTYRVQVTSDAGTTYTQMGANLPGPPAGPIVASGTPTTPVFYVELNIGGTPTIYRLSGPMNGTATLTAASNGLSSPSTFNVDPVDPLRLYAVDTGSGTAKFSNNGGQSWATDAALSSIVTKGNVYPFQTNAGGANISSFGFDPNSNTVIAGTNYSGIYSSADGGANWVFVRGSQQIPRVGNFAFDARNPGTIYVGSTGRGIWRINLPSSDLTIVKTHTPDPVTAGNALFYNVTVTNNGPDAASKITVTDNLPSQATYEANNDSCVEAPAGSGRLTCSLADLASGDSVTFTIKVLVRSDAAVQSGGPTSFDNTATVQSGETFDPDPGNNSSTDTTFVNESSDLSVAKVCDSSVQAGQTATCTVYVNNHGPSDARSVVLSDQISSTGTFTIQSATPSQGSPCTGVPGGPTSGATITCSLGNLAAASTTATGQATLVVQLRASDAQTISDVANARTDTPDPNGGNNTATSSIAITALADLAITGMTGTPDPVTAGNALTYITSIRNGGPSIAQNVQVADNLPAGVTINTVVGSNGASCTAGVPGDSTRPSTCAFGNLASGATRTMTIGVTVKPQTTGSLHSDARVSSDTFDGDMSNNLGHVDTGVQTSADLATTVTFTPNPVSAGTPLSYQVTVLNNGPSTAVAVGLTDALPSVLAFTSATTSAAGGTCGFQVNTNTVQCQLGNLDPGQSAFVYIYVNVSSGAPPNPALPNSATASSSTPDPTPGNNTGSVTTPVVTRADLGVTLGSDLSVYHPSTDIHYNIAVVNAGPSDAQSVVVTVQLPPLKSGYYVSDNDGCAKSGTTLTCSLGTIVAGASKGFQVNWHAQGNKGLITATASVSTTTTDPNSANNSSTRNVTVK